MKFIDSILKNLKLLYVEDDEFARDEIADFLEFEVGELKTASNGEEGLEIFKTFHPDIVITDINMPQMNGLELAKELRQIPSVRVKPILALTTENSPEMKQKGRAAGLTGWISKPFSKEKLSMALKRVLRI